MSLVNLSMRPLLDTWDRPESYSPTHAEGYSHGEDYNSTSQISDISRTATRTISKTESITLEGDIRAGERVRIHVDWHLECISCHKSYDCEKLLVDYDGNDCSICICPYMIELDDETGCCSKTCYIEFRQHGKH